MRVFAFFTAVICAFALMSIAAPAAEPAEQLLTYSPERESESVNAAAASVYEVGSRSFIYSYNSSEQRPIGHLAKLMVYLLAVEKIESGELSLSDTATVSARANSMQGAQIWLDIGEVITVDELMRSIAIGNANDACVALAERIAGSEEDLVAMMNSEALRLGMKNTVFKDSSGLDPGTVSTAADISLLIAELCRHPDSLAPFSIRLDEVRGGKAQLVSLNTLISSCKGAIGFKIGTLEHSGECAAEAVRRGDRIICSVILGSDPGADIAAEAERLMNKALADTVLFIPDFPEEAAGPLKAVHGQAHECSLEHGDIQGITLRTEDKESVTARVTLPAKLEAPVGKGEVVGSVSYYVGDRFAFSVKIFTGESISPVTFGYVFKKIWLNLLKC